MEEVQIVRDAEASLLLESMQRKLDKLWGPHNMHESKKHLFKPFVVSIGPFHRSQASLQATEEQKWRFLWDFLSRGDHINLDLCIYEMKLLEERTQRCYSEMVDLDSNDFVEMMLLDGCFIIEYYKNIKEGNFESFCEFGWNHLFVILDLMFLENQIPFFVVNKLSEIGLIEEHWFNYLIRCLPHPISNYTPNSNPPALIHHLTHLNYHCSVLRPENLVVLSSNSFLLRFLPGVLTWFPRSTSRNLSMTFPNSTGHPSSEVIPSATNLKGAGIKFKPKSNPQNIFDISFVHGVLEIPRLQISDFSKPLFVNLIAFEQCNFYKMPTNFSSFAVFLDSLVNTPNDAMILQQCGIIENCLVGEEELTHFFNLLNEGAICEDNYFLTKLFKEVNRHCESSCNRQRAKLIHDYFSSSWTTLSLVAALVLLVLTCVQSFFAVYGYFVPPS